ncbi:MAG: hypothetical protein M3R02_05630 [Chloroflexota bacterium]|nr:hypothetical protein [Chloroflexota bacterium]
MTGFVPVAAGCRGRRGFETAPTKRLVELLGRYRGMRDDATQSDAIRHYATEIVAELHTEFARRREMRLRNGEGVAA